MESPTFMETELPFAEEVSVVVFRSFLHAVEKSAATNRTRLRRHGEFIGDVELIWKKISETLRSENRTPGILAALTLAIHCDQLGDRNELVALGEELVDSRRNGVDGWRMNVMHQEDSSGRCSFDKT